MSAENMAQEMRDLAENIEQCLETNEVKGQHIIRALIYLFRDAADRREREAGA